MKKILLMLVMCFALTPYSHMLASQYTPDPQEWDWRASNNKMSLYTYKAPPELLKTDKTKNYTECAGYILVVEPENPDYAYIRMKIRLGVKQKEHAMWIQYLQILASDQEGNPVRIQNEPELDKWHPVIHDTVEEGYGLALYMALVEYAKSGYYLSSTSHK